MSQAFIQRLKEKGYSPLTLNHYRRILAYFSGDGYTQATIEAYQSTILHVSPVTRLNYLAKLRKYLKACYPHLADSVILPKVPQRLPSALPDQTAVKRILQLPDTSTFEGIRDRVILELFYSTGIRRKELINLKIEDLDFVRALIRINEGKNRKDRIVPISRPCLLWLRRYLDKVRPCLCPRCPTVFVGSHGLAMTPATPYKIIMRYANYSCHKYRHAFATHLLQNGMKETSLQRLLGHSQISTTQIYTRVTCNELQAEYSKYHLRDRWHSPRIKGVAC